MTRTTHIEAMENPSLAAGSVPAEISAFHAAELEAFAAMSRQRRPDAWAHVELLQRNCRTLSPATQDGALRAGIEIGMAAENCS